MENIRHSFIHYHTYHVPHLWHHIFFKLPEKQVKMDVIINGTSSRSSPSTANSKKILIYNIDLFFIL